MNSELQQAEKDLRTTLRIWIRRHRVQLLIQASLLILAGIAALVFPLFTGVALISLIGWVMIAGGIFQAITLIGTQNVPHFWWQMVSAALGVLIGALLVTNPGVGLVVLSMLFIVFFILEGISRVIFALTVRPVPNWGLVLLSGALGIALGAILWSQMPGAAAWLVSVLLGIKLLAEGLALGAMAFSAGRIARKIPEAVPGEEARTPGA